jgi:hypothetical protein
MTRSIFDPGGGETEHSGSTHMGPRADNISHMPPDVTDGEVAEEESADARALDAAEDANMSAEERLEVLTEGRVDELAARGDDALTSGDQSQRPA